MNTTELKKQYCILLIDDDEDDYVHLRCMFQEMTSSNYALEWASSYEAGIEALSQKEFDACLLDYRLGEKNGIELLQESRALGVECPTILLTGQGDLDVDLEAMQFGASDYLIKALLTAPLLERSLRYSIKHAMDMEQLKESKAQLLQQDRLASLGLLASSLAHEIGTPLGIIRSRAEMVSKRSAGDLKITSDMQIVISQIDRMTKLVNSLLHLAREKKANFGTKVNFTEVIKDMLNLIEHEMCNKQIKLITVGLDKEIFVKAEDGPLGQVLLNLFINSVHAIESARSRNKIQEHWIRIRASFDDAYTKISFQDSGCGISEKNLTQIFKPFFTTKDVGIGTGLGLAISTKFIQSWGGSLEVESLENEGATFTIKLLSAEERSVHVSLPSLADSKP